MVIELQSLIKNLNLQLISYSRGLYSNEEFKRVVSVALDKYYEQKRIERNAQGRQNSISQS